jgi:hypothetical protein
VVGELDADGGRCGHGILCGARCSEVLASRLQLLDFSF